MPYREVVGDHVLETLMGFEEGFQEGGDSIPLVIVQRFDNGGEKVPVVDTAFAAAVPQPNPTVLVTTVTNRSDLLFWPVERVAPKS